MSNETADLQPMFALLRTRPGMWKPLASDSRLFAIHALVASLRGAAEDVDGTFEFDSRRTGDHQYTAYGRFVAPGPQEELIDRARDGLHESFRRLGEASTQGD